MLRPWITNMPETPERYEAYLARVDDPRAALFFACRKEDGAIVGFLNISEIVRGPFKSAFLGYGAVADVRQGKYFELEIDAPSADDARRIAAEAADRLLANPVIESYRIEIDAAAGAPR